MNQASTSTAEEEQPDTGDRKKKRKSRWETGEGSIAKAIVPAGDGSRAIVAVFPKEVMLSNGIKVRISRDLMQLILFMQASYALPPSKGCFPCLCDWGNFLA